ncbi:YeeE/YedE family protein [Stenoxybacter acetivorans]|uniref:YeeE/YedE family protein n=1 Tax=Stenoxybacter acetivorans TaxID=422441 RepID=UPI00068A9B0C|nr:hypothetical protein [Stenoxybacter acetivorans]
MNETWLLPLAGGLLIGLSAALLWLLYGRIMGVSGITAGIGTQTRKERIWRLWFIVGLLCAGLCYRLWFGLPENTGVWAHQADWLRYIVLVAAGVLIGFGTRMGGGCTSGHGVCGLGRLSVRSAAAVIVFLCFGILIVAVLRFVLRVLQ